MRPKRPQKCLLRLIKQLLNDAKVFNESFYYILTWPTCILDVHKCWTTSYGWCSKSQHIDLYKNGCSKKVIDQIKPQIEVSDWYVSYTTGISM